jgi:hypothetical protein
MGGHAVKPLASLFILVAVILITAQSRANAESIYAVNATGALLRFDSATPGAVTTVGPVTGLVGGGSETIVGIDFRPATGEFFGISNASRLYRISPATGMATQVGADGAFFLSGTSFGFDFNPVPDRTRVVSDANQNLRLNPNNGALAAADGSLAYAGTDTNAGVDPNVVGVAYTNSRPGPVVSTTLYGIDSALDVLLIQTPPNAGVLNTVGALGVDVGDNVGFDISGATDIAYAAFQIGGAMTDLYTIDLSTGHSTLVGSVGGGTMLLLDIAVQFEAVPEPGTITLLGLGVLGVFGYRGRGRRFRL